MACEPATGVYRQAIADEFYAGVVPLAFAEALAKRCDGLDLRTGAVMMAPSDVWRGLTRRYARADVEATLARANQDAEVQAAIQAYAQEQGVDVNAGNTPCAYGRSVAGRDTGVGAFLREV